jgi:hypothetical protein
MDLWDGRPRILQDRLKAPTVKAENCCEQCTKLLTELWRPVWEMRGDNIVVDEGVKMMQHHDNYEALWHAARSGCRLCRVLLSEITQRTGSPAVRHEASIRFTHMRDSIELDAVEVHFLIDVAKNKINNNGKDQDKSYSTRIEIPFRFEYADAEKQEFVYGESMLESLPQFHL